MLDLQIKSGYHKRIGKSANNFKAVLPPEGSDLVKNEGDNPSIGLILCKDKGKFTTNYALDGITKPIGISSFEVEEWLPGEEELNLLMDVD